MWVGNKLGPKTYLRKVFDLMSTVTQIEYEFQGGYVRASVKNPAPAQKVVRALRGQVSTFSAASRRRLMALLNRLEWSGLSAAFCSLTYGQLFPDIETFKRHIDIFGKRMMRWAARHGCRVSIVWKMEFQERGAPHLHLIVFGLPSSMTEFELRQLMRWTWALSIGGDYWDKSDSDYWRVPFVQADWVTSKRAAMGYVSKYLAKVDVGQSVGDTRNVLSEHVATDGASAVDGFNNVSYLTAPSGTGRIWGVIGRVNLPFAELVTVSLAAAKSGFFGLRRLAAAKLRSQWKSRPLKRRRRRASRLLFPDDPERRRRVFYWTSKPPDFIHGRLQSFSLFVDDALEWFDMLYWLVSSA